MADSTVTIEGNLTRDPEVRYTPSGAAVTQFGVAVNKRWQNRTTQEWQEETSFFTVQAWAELGLNASESLNKGDRVIVTGQLEQRSWETPEGDKRSVVEIRADDIGASFKFATAKVERIRKGDGNRPPMPTDPHAGNGAAGPAAEADDPDFADL